LIHGCRGFPFSVKLHLALRIFMVPPRKVLNVKHSYSPLRSEAAGTCFSHKQTSGRPLSGTVPSSNLKKKNDCAKSVLLEYCGSLLALFSPPPTYNYCNPPSNTPHKRSFPFLMQPLKSPPTGERVLFDCPEFMSYPPPPPPPRPSACFTGSL